MATFGTFQNGVVVLDPGSGYVPEGTRVEVSLTTGMEPLIRKTAGVNGGDACIGTRRIAVWMLVEYRRQGLDDADLLERFPGISTHELAAAWTYASVHAEEIEKAIGEHGAE